MEAHLHENGSDGIDRLLLELNALKCGSFASTAQRVQVKDALLAALSRIETPWETALRLVFTEPAIGAALKICYDVDLFKKWIDDLGAMPADSEALAKLVGVDEVLLSRLLQHLAATHILLKTASGRYIPTAFSAALATSELGSTVPFLYQTTLPGYSNLPGFLKASGYSDPCNGAQTNWHQMCGGSRFEELRRRPSDMAVFQAVMRAYAANKEHWTALFSVEQLLRQHSTAADLRVPLLVDVGGGTGYDVKRLRAALVADLGLAEASKYELVLQDLGNALPLHEKAQIDGVRVMEHDFFLEQPIKGATAYYLHTVLHDWSDEQAIAILRGLAAACAPGRSRVLIHEIIITGDAPAAATTSDMQMMMVLSSRERTEEAWRAIVTGAGLRVAAIWGLPGSMESVIEAVKVD
ncbi:O-methyltransferase-domain-containing protein [Nemania sp. FL0916]|nr:O-methyltransferase-domain-containing protein [Nemania sp. FL0916]